MFEQKNSADVLIGLGIFEGHLNVAKDKLRRLHNRLDNSTSLKIDIIPMIHVITKMIQEDSMHHGKLSLDKAQLMAAQIKQIIEGLAMYRRSISADLLPHIAHVVENLNIAKDDIQAVINDISEEVAVKTAQASQINP